MSDKERKDRQGHHPSGSHSSGAGALSFLPSIFGRRPAPAPAVTSRISTSTADNPRKSIDHDSIEGITSPKDKGNLLGIPDVLPPRRSPSPAPFDLEEAMRFMAPKSGESPEVIVQMVKATAVYLAGLLITNEDMFSEHIENQNPKDGNVPTKDQLQTLYLRAYNFASPSSESSLRIAAIRLLAALFATSPPPKSPLQADPDMEAITVQSLYRAVTTPSSDNTTSLEQTFVIVGALKALTKNGAEVEGLSGLVGWLVKALGNCTDDWIKYCSARDDIGIDMPERTKVSLSLLCSLTETLTVSLQVQPFAPIRPATGADVQSSIIDLLHAIIAQHVPLFGQSDITRVVQPMLDLVWLGIAAAPLPERAPSVPIIPGSTLRRGSPASSLNSPAFGSTLGLGFDQYRS